MDGTGKLDWASLFRRSDLEEIEDTLRSDEGSLPVPGRFDEYGNTRTHLAAAYSSLPVLLHFLGKHGADEVNYYGQTLLMSACMDTKLEKVRHLVDTCGCDVHQTDYCGNTALHVAAALSSIPVIEYLLSKGSDLSKENEEGVSLLSRISHKNHWEENRKHSRRGFETASCFTRAETPLTLACTTNSLEVCKYLVCEADTRKVEILPSHLLMRSCFDSDVNKVKYFYSVGGSVDYKEDIFTPLHLASEKDAGYSVVEYLLAKGAKTLKDSSWTAYHSAAYSGTQRNIQALKRQDSDFCALADEWSPLHIAATCADVETLEFVVNTLMDIAHISEAHLNILHHACRDTNLAKVVYLCENLPVAAINHKLENGETPLHYAARLSSLEIVKYLISRGADIFAKDTYECSIFHWASLGSSTEIAEYLLEFGFDINGTDKTGETPLMKAAWTGSVEMMQFLLQNGAAIKIGNITGNTIMHSVCGGKKLENVRYLLQQNTSIQSKPYSFSVNIRNNQGLPAFMRSVISGYAPMVHNIKVLGADFSLLDDEGESALHKAIDYRTPMAVVKFLLRNRLNANRKNNKGRTPLQCAATYSSHEILALLYNNSNQCHDLDGVGNNLLHRASRGKNKDNIKFFIDRGFNIQSENDHGEKPIHLAAEHGNRSTIEYLVFCGASVNEANKEGKRPLGLACMVGTIEKAEALLDNGAEVNLPDIDDLETALHRAAIKSESVDLVRFLIKKGADINARDKRGYSILHSAAYGKGTDIIRELMSHGLQLDETDYDGNTVAATACGFGSQAVIEFILKEGIDLLAKNKFGETALHYLYHNDESILAFLASKGFDFKVTSDKGETPIHLAAAHGKLAHMKYFVEKTNLDILSKTNEGNTFLHCACEGKNVKLVEYLIQLIEINVKNNEYETPLHAAAQKSTADIVDLLLKNGAEINVADNVGFTSLHYAVDHGDLDVVKCLVKAGADIHAKGKNDQTILHVVAGTRHVEVAEYVMSLGIDLELTEREGATAAFYAAGYGSKEMMECFIKKRANLSAKTSGKMSLIHMAAQNNRTDVLEFLLNYDVHIDLFSRDISGKTPLHYALRNEHTLQQNASILLDRGSDVNVVDNLGNTVLHDACSQNKDLKEAAQLLHEAGVGLNIANKSGETALHQAASSGNIKCIEYLLQNGADLVSCDNEGLAPIHKAFTSTSSASVKLLISHGADMHMEDAEGNPAFASCRQEMEKEFLLYHVLEENLSLEGMLKSIKQWGATRFNKGLVWYSFAGGSVKDVISIAQLEHLSEQQINLVLVSDPLFLNNHKEAILLETSLKPDNYYGLSLLMEKKIKSVPRLQEFCRSEIRKLLHKFGSIFPIAKKMKSEVLLTRSALNFTFLIDEMSSIESDIHNDLIYFLTHEDASPMSIDFTTPKDATPEPTTSDFWQLLFTKQTTEQPDVLLVQGILEWSNQSDSPRWILDGVAGTCPDGLYTDATSHNPTEESEKFVLGYLRLYNTFLSLLKQHDGPSLSGKGYGSYFAGTQVMDLDEMDFMAIQHDEEQEITRIDGPGNFFHVRKPLSKQHDYAGTMKQYIYQALREYLKGEKRPEDPSTGQVFVQACYPYPVAPAVCTVFAWQCFSGHRHHISVDLTPAIIWKDKKLSDIYRLPQALNREPFLAAKQDLESLPPMLIPSPVSHVECLDHYITSSWELSFCNTKDIMWRVLDGVSGNIRLLFKQVKVIRNHILPYILKFSPGTDPEKGSWQGGCVVSSWVLYNILLQQVLIHPAGSCWEDPAQRLLGYLDSLLHWRYYEFFTGKEEHSTKWSDTDPKLRHLLLEQMTDDINRVKLSIRASDDVTYSLEEMISQISGLHEKESVLVTHYACNHGDGEAGGH